MPAQTGGFNGEKFGRSHLLKNFAAQHREKFPVLTTLIDWDVQTTVFLLHQVVQGTELVIHGWTRQSKLLATIHSPFNSSSNFLSRYFVIPLTYQGKFRIRPIHLPLEYTASDLASLRRGHYVTVTDINTSRDSSSLKPGDVIRVRSVKGHQPKQTITCDKVEGSGKVTNVVISSESSLIFSELNDKNGLTKLTCSSRDLGLEDDAMVSARDLSALLSEEGRDPVAVELIQLGPDHRSYDTDLPLGVPIVLRAVVTEPAVYASVQKPSAPAFHIPMRTLIYLRLLKQLPRECSPLLMKTNPKLSTLDRSAEVVTHDVYIELCCRAPYKSLMRSHRTAESADHRLIQNNESQNSNQDTKSPQKNSKTDSSKPEGRNKSFWNKLGLKLKRTKSTDNLNQLATVYESRTLPIKRNKEKVKVYETRTLGRLPRSSNTMVSLQPFSPFNSSSDERGHSNQPPNYISDNGNYSFDYDTDSSMSVRGRLSGAGIGSGNGNRSPKSEYRGTVRQPTPESPMIGLIIEPTASPRVKKLHAVQTKSAPPSTHSVSLNSHNNSITDFSGRVVHPLPNNRPIHIIVAKTSESKLNTDNSQRQSRRDADNLLKKGDTTPVSIRSLTSSSGRNIESGDVIRVNLSREALDDVSNDVTMRSNETDSSHDINSNNKRVKVSKIDKLDESPSPSRRHQLNNSQRVDYSNSVIVLDNKENRGRSDGERITAPRSHRRSRAEEEGRNRTSKLQTSGQTEHITPEKSPRVIEQITPEKALRVTEQITPEKLSKVNKADDRITSNNEHDRYKKLGAKDGDQSGPVVLNGSHVAPRRKERTKRIDQESTRNELSVLTEAPTQDVGTSVSGLYANVDTSCDNNTANGQVMISEMTSTTDLQPNRKDSSTGSESLRTSNVLNSNIPLIGNIELSRMYSVPQEKSLFSIEPSSGSPGNSDNPVVFPISCNVISDTQLWPEDLRLPSDGNLYHLTCYEFLKFLSSMNLSDDVINLCRKYGVDGKRFSKMTSEDLDRFDLNHPVIVYFRKKTVRVRNSHYSIYK